MAISTTTRSLCNKIVNDYPGLTSPIRQSRNTIRQKAYEFENQLRNTVFSSESAIDAALESFEDQVGEILPGDTAQDVQDVKDFLDNCDYLSALNGVSAIAGTALGIYNGIEDIIDSIGDSTPEFKAGSFADSINNLLEGLQFPFGDNISDLFSKADKLIECLVAFCGGEYPLQVIEFSNDIGQLYTDMNIIDDPLDPNYTRFNYDGIYDNLQLSSVERSNMTKTIDKIYESHTTANESINSCIDAIKDSIRLQGIGGL